MSSRRRPESAHETASDGEGVVRALTLVIGFGIGHCSSQRCAGLPTTHHVRPAPDTHTDSHLQHAPCPLPCAPAAPSRGFQVYSLPYAIGTTHRKSRALTPHIIIKQAQLTKVQALSCFEVESYR